MRSYYSLLKTIQMEQAEKEKSTRQKPFHSSTNLNNSSALEKIVQFKLSFIDTDGYCGKLPSSKNLFRIKLINFLKGPT